MEFQAYPLRRDGKLLPHHLRWTGGVRGDLYVQERHDSELSRVVKVASLLEPSSRKELLKPLHDIVLLSVKPDWWTMTGWERVIEDTTGYTRALQQSWILVPFDMLSASERA